MPQSFNNLRDYLDFLEQRGHLHRVKMEVDWDLEVTQIADVLIKEGDKPALLFENIKDSSMSLCINLFGTTDRMAWALGVDNLDEIVVRLQKILNMAQTPPTGWVEKFRALGDLAKISSNQPKVIQNAPCQEIVLTGEDIDLFELPILKCWPDDAGRFITLPLVITRDPDVGSRNVGIYRMQVFDKKTTGMHWQTHKVGAQHERSGKDKGIGRLEVAVALGGDPATIWAGSVPFPPGIDEFSAAGLIREKPVELVKCKTVDLEVPAHAEIILEGYVDLDQRQLEGPFGDHTGYYSQPEMYSVFHITAITRRSDPIYPTIVVGRPPSEDYFMGKATERIMLPLLQLVLPEIQDINMPAEGIFHNLLIVSIKKEYPGHAQKVMHGIWGLGLLQLTKLIVVVDDFVDVQDLSEVAWRVTNNIDARRDVSFVDGPVDDLDHASSAWRYGSKAGIDATRKLKGEQFSREWPDDVVMSEAIKGMVARRWGEYGL
jgi:4-hydroxy-3-polyprenylbenzoate decarboxylase